MDKNEIKQILTEATEETEVTQDTGAQVKLDEVPGLEKVKSLLALDIFNHSAVIRKLWGDSEATNRSLFRKKLESFKDDDGVEYAFTKEEVEKINGILQNVSSDISHTLGDEDIKKAKISHKQRSLRNQ